MSSSMIIYIAELVIGILINIFIGKICVGVFRKDNTATRIPVRFAGIFLIINSLSYIFKI